MKDQLLLIQKNPDKKEIKWIRGQFDPSDTQIFLTEFIKPVQELSDFDQQVYIPPADMKSRINRESFRGLLKFGDTIDSSKFSHSQILQYQKLNLWYYNKFRAYYWLRESWYQREILKQLVEEFDSVTLLSATDSHNFLINLPGVDIISGKTKRKGSRISRLVYLFQFLIRGLVNPIVRSNPVNKIVLVSPSERLQPIMNLNDLKLERNDPFFAYLLERYGDAFVLMDEMKIPDRPGDTYPGLFPSHHKKFYLGEGIMLRAMFIPRIWREWSIVKNKVKRILKKMISNEVNEINRAILIYLQSMQSSHNYYIFRYLAYRRFFRKRKIQSVLATDENSMFTKVILDAAKQVGLLTIGMQHGNIHSLHPAYMFSEKDIENHPMPDYTFVWGDLWKKVLIHNGNYREKELIVVGQLRTDIIPKLKQLQSNREFNIVFASQPQTDPVLRRRAAVDVMNTARDLQVGLRIKLHPRENDPEYYRNIAEECELTNYEFTGNEDLYLVIQKSGVVITCYSTVGAETAYFRKPLIILDYLKEDVNGYYREGISFQASNAKELKQRVSEIQDGKVIPSGNYDRYIEQCAFRVDGNVAKRMMEWLKQRHPVTSDNAG
jgi:predicted Rdx family selenoprotein